MGIALVDMTKLDAIGGNRNLWLDDFRMFLWQPMWVEFKRRRSLN